MNIRVRSPHTRDSKRSPDTALMIISVDDPIPEWAIEEIKGTGDIFGITLVKV